MTPEALAAAIAAAAAAAPHPMSVTDWVIVIGVVTTSIVTILNTWKGTVDRKAVADLYGGLDVREGRERFHPFENLSAHYLLLAQRIP